MSDWIPASEPPKTSDPVIIATIDGRVGVGFCYYDMNCGERYWLEVDLMASRYAPQENRLSVSNTDVAKWQPLPEQYRGGE